MNFLHHSRTVLAAGLVCSSHLSGGSFAHAIEELVESGELFVCQGLLKGYAELAPLVRELSGVYLALSVIVHRINHLYTSFRFYWCKTNCPNFAK